MHTDTDLKSLIDRLEQNRSLSRDEWTCLIRDRTPELAEYLFQKARDIRIRHYGRDIFIRGLIEFTSYCRNDCYYCGIRCSNKAADRYRLTKEDILACCKTGYELGFRTFVLQGGEDGWYTDDRLEEIISSIHGTFPDCAVTLSVGERSFESYRRFARAGADRYLLRHETYDEGHYRKLHPPRMSAAHRKQCLWDLKKLGYQVGTGFMVGAPYQTPENLADDMLFLKELNPRWWESDPLSPPRHSFCRETCRDAGTYSVSAGTDPPYASAGSAPRHHCSGHDCSGRKRTGHSGRRQCSHAESFSSPCTGKISALR